MNLYHSCNDYSLQLHEDQSMAQRLLDSPAYTKRVITNPMNANEKKTFLHHSGVGDFGKRGELHYVIVH